jgi:DNA-directed RNA polymerase specialized sigma24 family protein
MRLVDTFEGVSMGELVNACKTLARGICIDVQRAAVRRREREGISLDAGRDDDGGERPVPRWEADEAAERFARAERGAEATDFLEWALPQVKEDRRAVLVATFAGAELAEIADALAISRENAYQRRSRGMKDLARLKERYDE